MSLDECKQNSVKLLSQSNNFQSQRVRDRQAEREEVKVSFEQLPLKLHLPALSLDFHLNVIGLHPIPVVWYYKSESGSF